jgi:hypothetical protein
MAATTIGAMPGRDQISGLAFDGDDDGSPPS